MSLAPECRPRQERQGVHPSQVPAEAGNRFRSVPDALTRGSRLSPALRTQRPQEFSLRMRVVCYSPACRSALRTIRAAASS